MGLPQPRNDFNGRVSATRWIHSVSQDRSPNEAANSSDGQVSTYLCEELREACDIYSIFIPCSFQASSPSRPDTDVYIATDIKQLLNNLLVAVMVSWSLVFSMNGVGSIIQVVGGFQTEDAVNNPMFGSISPSDFWGNRWNKLIHRGLKQGVYKPVRAQT